VMAARVPLGTLRDASAPVARPAGRRDRRAGADQLAGGRFTVTVIVPAYNEEGGIRDTLDALTQQTDRPERIIVVDDCSQDNTGPVAREYGVEVLRPPHNLGSKAKAQNYALPYCATDLVLPVDADTILAADYVERIKQPFEDPRVVIAAGNVQTKVARTVTERGRSIEYLYGFHFYRPIQNRAGAPVVCSGCCSAFRREVLVASGGFPERTIVEDFDWTATQQIAGNKAVYVAAAEAWAADPETIRYLRKQMNRWMSGFFQDQVRLRIWAGYGLAWLAYPVFPAFLPGEVLLDEVFQRDAAEEVVQAPPGGDVPDDQHPLPAPAQGQVGEEAADAGGGLPPAFPARVGLVQVRTPAGV